MRLWPFPLFAAQREKAIERAVAVQQRAISFSNAIADATEAEAAASAETTLETGLAVQEACASLWERAFASATVSTARARDVCTPSVLALVGRQFVRQGESCWLLEFRNGRLQAGIASSWEVNGAGVFADNWRYRLDVLGPSGNRTRRARADGVLHFMIGRDPAAPWQGIAPLAHASTTRKLAASLEARLGQEVAAAVGNLIALPRDPGTRTKPDGTPFDPLEEIRRALASLRGKTVLVETTASGWGDGRIAAPRNDWRPQRLGADPPATLNALRQEVGRIIAAACGVPPSLLQESSDGTAQRESWRRFLHGSIAPAGRIVEEELSAKLEEPVRLNFDALFASDLSGRARAFQSMVKAGMDPQKAAALAGLMEEE